MTARREPPLPDKVKVGPLTYDVKNDTLAHMLAEHEQKVGLAGACDSVRQTITIKPGMAPGQARSALLHEVTHAAIHVSGINIDDAEEERLVSALEMPLLGVLRDNPVLVAYLAGGSA